MDAGAVVNCYTDHPRSRGVYGEPRGLPQKGRGSSPLARGLHKGSRRSITGIGIIPARAGFTFRPGRRRPRRRDHPRSRGVYQGTRSPARDHRGSSPLARGLPLTGPEQDPGPRIIPARAGFTDRHDRRGGGLGDHPRSRGVYRPTAWRRRRSRRIIPARAGFTTTASTTRDATSDHPRSRGVYEGHVEVDDDLRGSSPLARGLLRSARRGPSTGRIIPARAGFTHAAKAPLDSPTGSSPLARGLRLRTLQRPRSRRIIPARAGFTRRALMRPPPSSDHPRSRGVYCSRRASKTGEVGSSPLARGLPERARGQREWAGIIPARAGFTWPPRPH